MCYVVYAICNTFFNTDIRIIVITWYNHVVMWRLPFLKYSVTMYVPQTNHKKRLCIVDDRILCKPHTYQYTYLVYGMLHYMVAVLPIVRVLKFFKKILYLSYDVNVITVTYINQ